LSQSNFTDRQAIDAVKHVAAVFAVPDICREQGISAATFYKWRAKYGGMDVSMMSRMKELEDENRRLKKMDLEEKLKAEIVAEALEKSGEAISNKGDGH
jgi:putative transposase